MSLAEVLTVPPLGRHSNGMAMIAEEFDAAEEWDDQFRYELINGVLIVNPPPGWGERRPNDELVYLFLDYQREHPQGSALTDTVGEHTLKLSGNRRRVDRVVWVGLESVEDPNTIPAIAIEFVGRSSRDRKRDFIIKRAEYREAGVQEYWVIDRYRRNMTVFRGDDAIVIGESETYTTPLLPGFELPLGQLLAHVGHD